MKLKGKVAIVTGASRGIGRGIADKFQAEGAIVYAMDLGFSQQPSVSGAASDSNRMLQITCDISIKEDVTSAITQILKHKGCIDILVNNAGVNPSPATIEDTSDQQLDRILATNLKGIFNLSQAALPHMREGGAILNIASILGFRGTPSCAAYTASKGAVIALTKAMAKDHAPAIRVNSISPGAIETDMFDEYLKRVEDAEEERGRVASGIPLQRIGIVEDIAYGALFLVSDDAIWITGHNLVIDGGDSI